MTAYVLFFGLGMSLFVVLSLALRLGYTTITTAPAGGCLCPENRPSEGDLTPALAAALHARHRHCPGCALDTLARDALEKAATEPIGHPPPRSLETTPLATARRSLEQH